MESMTQRLLTKGFGRPSGLLGRLGGRLMAHGNAATERRVVALVAPTEQDVVLVIGPGPGVGLEAAARRSAHVIGIDPSDVMLAMARRRCASAVTRGRLRLAVGTAARTGEPDNSVDVVISVNNLQLWPDVPAGLAELHRVLRPGGRMLLAAHEKWLPTALPLLANTVLAAGFTTVRTWTWDPPTRMASTTALLSAARV
ncbi:class I SAM-dependent methyltransferase [Streptomyces sp. NPDC059979]|uniref:class I SAM-dependent methyltransferase n=2 Tax=unclassified Streptomyces TaxID=2593676 RepID=UPI00369B8E01